MTRRLRFEVARPIPVEPALTEPEPPTENLLEHLAFQGTDGGVEFGQLMIGTRVLPQDGREAYVVMCDLGLDPLVVENR